MNVEAMGATLLRPGGVPRTRRSRPPRRCAATGKWLEPTWPSQQVFPWGLMTIDHVLADRHLGVGGTRNRRPAMIAIVLLVHFWRSRRSIRQVGQSTRPSLHNGWNRARWMSMTAQTWCESRCCWGRLAS